MEHITIRAAETKADKSMEKLKQKRGASSSPKRRPGRPKRRQIEINSDTHSNNSQPSPRLPSAFSMRIYNGTAEEDLEQWISELKIKIYGIIDDSFKIEAIRAYTSGRARDFLNKFIADSHDQVKKDPKENLEHFSLRIGELVRKALPTNDKHIQMRMQIEYFINGLAPDLAALVRNRVPLTLEKAMKYATQYEGENNLKHKEKERKLEKENKTPILAAACEISSMTEQKQMLDKIMEEFKRFREEIRTEIKISQSPSHSSSINPGNNGYRFKTTVMGNQKKDNDPSVRTKYANFHTYKPKLCFVCSKLGHLRASLPAIILGCTLKTCVDTGSTKSFIHASFLENLGSSTFDLIPLDKPILVKMGNGETMICHNKVELTLQIGNDVYPFEFLTADKLLFDSILGMDFMKISTDQIQLPPKCHCFVVAQPNRKFCGHALVSNHGPLNGKFGVYVAKGPKIWSPTVFINLKNLSDQTVNLSPGTILSQLKLLKENEYELLHLNTLGTNESKLNPLDEFPEGVNVDDCDLNVEQKEIFKTF
ncbi:hypothetical protein BpHYR1_000301 [Brachionus plicatilis]|uniref:Uncharacterized protein n=1 Tax=Brachionus plicatilis TaxID=10195 RepID=A0A3M7Q993_BRAPC|nr:hypothetical protein BpHYR1_000301 [Brachionus plicatilis]